MDMQSLESWLRQHATYSPDQLKIAPIRDLLASHQIEPLSHRGMLSYVYKFKDTPWVVKEGKWNMDLHFLGDLKLKFPVEVAEKILRDRVLPREAEISRQYALYLKLIRYLGVFSVDNYYHPEITAIRLQQLTLRENLAQYIDEVSEDFKIKYPEHLKFILESELKYKNFLPKEYLVVGEGWHPDNKQRQTYFIFQEFIPGQAIHDISLTHLVADDNKRHELILFTFLLLLFYKHEKLVIDTRPRSPAAQIHQWLMKTDNIFVSESGLTLIDTRSCWHAEDDLFRRGLLIPDVTMWNIQWWFNKLLNIEGHHPHSRFDEAVLQAKKFKAESLKWLQKNNPQKSLSKIKIHLK